MKKVSCLLFSGPVQRCEYHGVRTDHRNKLFGGFPRHSNSWKKREPFTCRLYTLFHYPFACCFYTLFYHHPFTCCLYSLFYHHPLHAVFTLYSIIVLLHAVFTLCSIILLHAVFTLASLFYHPFICCLNTLLFYRYFFQGQTTCRCVNDVKGRKIRIYSNKSSCLKFLYLIYSKIQCFSNNKLLMIIG